MDLCAHGPVVAKPALHLTGVCFASLTLDRICFISLTANRYVLYQSYSGPLRLLSVLQRTGTCFVSLAADLVHFNISLGLHYMYITCIKI